MTASMVPVCSMTSRKVIAGSVGSRPMSFSATMTCAELDTGSISHAPWITARMRICTTVMRAPPLRMTGRRDRGLAYRGVETRIPPPVRRKPCRARPGASRREGLQLAPHTLDQPLDGFEARLVGHLAALLDPVTEIQIRQLQFLAALDLPQDVVGSVARTGDIRIVEGVHRREPVVQAVDQAHHAQSAVFAELEQVGGDVAVQEEVLVLLAAVLVHAAARMAMALVLQ